MFYPLAVRPSLLKLNKWGTAHLGKHVGRTLSACISNVIVFLLVGLWHGAETHYVLWGLYNGIVIAASDMLRPAFDALSKKLNVNVESAGYRVFAILRTFLLVNIGRYFDRLVDFNDCITGFFNTLFNFRLEAFGTWFALHPVDNMRSSLILAVVCCVIVFVVSLRRERGEDVKGQFLALPLVVRLLVYTFVGALVAFSFSIAGGGGGFLYANF